MPLYLVRWPDLTAAFVNAADEDELIDILDEVANPDGATWAEYDGPLHVEFEVPAKWDVVRDPTKPEGAPLEAEQLVVEDVSEIELGELRATAQAGGDTSSAMIEEIYRLAFPHLHAVLYERSEEEPDPERVREATRQELMRQIQASWRIRGTARRDDPISRNAAAMDASPRWVEAQLRRHAAAAQPPKPPAPKKPSSRKRRRRK